MKLLKIDILVSFSIKVIELSISLFFRSLFWLLLYSNEKLS